MKYAVIDTETSGLFDFSKPADAEGQPRLANLAIIVLNEDLSIDHEIDYMVAPLGWEMKPEATAVNGLTTEHLLAKGLPVVDALNMYAALIDRGYIIATFNAQFDTKVMRGEMRRANVPDRFETTPNVCIMRALTNVVRVPKKSGSGYKWPKLGEACAFFKIEQPAAHSAMGDARSAVELLRHLHKANLIPEAEVHFAKTQPTPVAAP